MALGPYSDTQYGVLIKRMQDYSLSGNPQWSRDIQVQIDAEIPFDKIIIPDEVPDIKLRFTPETSVAAHLVDMPNRQGANSSRDLWAQFAKLVSTVDHDVIAVLGRDGIVHLMEDRGIIPTLEPTEEDESSDT